jgi:hypothetical protein
MEAVFPTETSVNFYWNTQNITFENINNIIEGYICFHIFYYLQGSWNGCTAYIDILSTRQEEGLLSFNWYEQFIQ